MIFSLLTDMFHLLLEWFVKPYSIEVLLAGQPLSFKLLESKNQMIQFMRYCPDWKEKIQ